MTTAPEPRVDTTATLVNRPRSAIAVRQSRQREDATSGPQRYRPGPGETGGYAPWQSTSSRTDNGAALDSEIEFLAKTVQEQGTLSERELYRSVGARYWGPGRYRPALRQAVREGRVTKPGSGKFGPPPEAQAPKQR